MANCCAGIRGAAGGACPRARVVDMWFCRSCTARRLRRQIATRCCSTLIGVVGYVSQGYICWDVKDSQRSACECKKEQGVVWRGETGDWEHQWEHHRAPVAPRLPDALCEPSGRQGLRPSASPALTHSPPVVRNARPVVGRCCLPTVKGRHRRCACSVLPPAPSTLTSLSCFVQSRPAAHTVDCVAARFLCSRRILYNPRPWYVHLRRVPADR
jgi:hypothetical protein